MVSTILQKMVKSTAILTKRDNFRMMAAENRGLDTCL